MTVGNDSYPRRTAWRALARLLSRWQAWAERRAELAEFAGWRCRWCGLPASKVTPCEYGPETCLGCCSVVGCSTSRLVDSMRRVRDNPALLAAHVAEMRERYG